MQRLNAAACLLFALLFGAAVCPAAARMKIQVVQAHTGVKLGLGRLELVSNSNPAWSRCSGASGTYSRGLGFHCEDAGSSPSPETESRVEVLFYDVQVIMPGAAHLVFHCSTVLDPDCQGLPEYPKDTSVVCSDFTSRGAAYKDCTATGSSAEGIGVYQAALHGNRMTIFGSNWQRNYQQYGKWDFEAQDPQDPKPDPAQETQETKPATSAEAKPGADAAPDTKAPGPAATVTSPISTAAQVIDPRIIEQAKAGDPISQYKLGYDYFLGRGVPLDYVQAAIWWRKAADQGYPDAQNNLGVLYNTGKGVPQSYTEAYFWQNLAAARASGTLQAQFAKNRDESGSKLWLLSRLKVQQRAAKWAADHPVPPRSHEPADAKRGEYP